MKIDGACHCGRIFYEAEALPEDAAICHCTDCQTLSGSAFRTIVLTKKGSFKLRSGEPKIYVKTGESGVKRQQAFCPECGSPIFSTTVDDGPKVHSIRLRTASATNLRRKHKGGFAPPKNGSAISTPSRNSKSSVRVGDGSQTTAAFMTFRSLDYSSGEAIHSHT